MAGEEDRDFVNFLKSLDPGLLKYKNQFEKYDVQSLTTLKYSGGWRYGVTRWYVLAKLQKELVSTYFNQYEKGLGKKFYQHYIKPSPCKRNYPDWPMKKRRLWYYYRTEVTILWYYYRTEVST